jgi:hypothetical protein
MTCGSKMVAIHTASTICRCRGVHMGTPAVVYDIDHVVAKGGWSSDADDGLPARSL